jgi:hypothetical protein
MKDLLSDTPLDNSIEAIRVETALSRFPVHALSYGEVKINLQNMGTATKWEVNYNSGFGQPGQLAYKIDTLIVNRRIEESERPIPKLIRLGSLREISAELSTSNKSGTSQNLIKKSLQQNASAFITAKISYRTKEGVDRSIEFGDTRYAVIFTGEKLPDGRNADGVYIVLHDFYREILNFAQTRPLDYAYMKTLPPMAQRFYEIVSYVIYAALRHKNPSCKMRYSEFCKLSTAQRYYTFDQVKKQMYKVHQPHVASGYIQPKITYQAFTDEENQADWWMFYIPGVNAGKQYEEFVEQPKRRMGTTEIPPRQMLLSIFDDVPAIPDFPQKTRTSHQEEQPIDLFTLSTPDRPLPDKEKPPVDEETLALSEELIQAGVGRGEALTLATSHPEEARQQLAYLPYAEVKTTPGAFLATAIRKGFGAPKGFLEVKAKQDLEDQKRKVEEAKFARARAESLKKEMEAAEIDSQMATLEAEDPEGYQAFEMFIEWEKAKALDKPFLKLGSVSFNMISDAFNAPERRRELYRAWYPQKETWKVPVDENGVPLVKPSKTHSPRPL